MKRIKWIWILGAILCVGCGSQAGKEPAQTSTPSPTSTEQPYVEPTAPPGAATQAVEKRNVTIQGHSYKYIFYTEYDDSLAVLFQLDSQILFLDFPLKTAKDGFFFAAFKHLVF